MSLCRDAVELVVARYQEDLAWLRRTPRGVRVTVYDKGGGMPDAVVLPNVGRESHTYLHHVVTRYESLAEVTVFCQGRPFDHVPDFHRRLRRLADGREPVRSFRWLGFVIDWDDVTGARLFRHWSKNPEGRELDLAGFWRELWPPPVPDRFVFYPGGNFAVTATQVRSQPLEFYSRALRVSLGDPDRGHCFERCWDRIFGAEGVPPDLRALPLPIYLRPVRRLGITWADVPAAHRGW